MYGADIAQLRALASQLLQAAQRLEQTQRVLTHQLTGVTAWRGPDAERFRQQWHTEGIARISGVMSALTAGAELLRRNADEQESASLAAGGVGTGAIGAPIAIADGGRAAGVDVAAILSGLLTLGGASNDLARLAERGFGGITGGVLSGAAVVTSLTSMVEGITAGDDLQTAGGVIGLGGVALGRINPVLGIAATAATMYGDLTLPTSNEDIDGVFDAGARSMFGKDVDQLTDQQQSALNQRYDGLWGVANMISDSMDHKMAEAGRFFGGLFGS